VNGSRVQTTPAVSFDRFIFVTVKLLPDRHPMVEHDYARLAAALARMRIA
jgi:hypothetical protein